MTKEERIEAFNAKSAFLNINTAKYKEFSSYAVSVCFDVVYSFEIDEFIKDFEIDEFIKELTEAKEIMEAEND